MTNRVFVLCFAVANGTDSTSALFSVATSVAHYENEYTLTKFIHENIPCDCLKGAKRCLKKEPRLTQCMNNDCGKVLPSKQLKVCGVCRNAFYCSKDCQKADWDQHKLSCNQAMGTDNSGKKAYIRGLFAAFKN